MIKKYYRICDSRGGKTVIQAISKRHCFQNFIKVFGTSDFVVIADNSCHDTIDFLRSFTDNVTTTSLGNSKSFIHTLDLAIQNDDDQIVYLVEDDYLHLEDSEKYIEQALEHADYVSLYDHPDKYMNPSPNPFVRNGAEDTKVILTESTHWKFTNSTTMTFAAKASTLKQDYDIMKTHCTNEIPQDFHMFYTLGKQGRTLITPIPAKATHCDNFPSPFIFNNTTFPILEQSVNPP